MLFLVYREGGLSKQYKIQEKRYNFPLACIKYQTVLTHSTFSKK